MVAEASTDPRADLALAVGLLRSVMRSACSAAESAGYAGPIGYLLEIADSPNLGPRIG